LKNPTPYDERESMAPDFDTASLQRPELIALVQQLRQQLAERDREIEQLKCQLAEAPTLSAADKPTHDATSVVYEEPHPGSQEDLLEQLEKIYPADK